MSTFYVPGLTSTIEQVKFHDSDGDGFPEVLISDGNKVAVYSPDDDAILFEIPIDAGVVNYSILFDDVNRDHMPDILIGCYFENGFFDRDTVCRTDLYDGASDYTAAETVFFDFEIDFETAIQPPSSFVAFESLDVTGDGYNELFFSFDRCRFVSLGANEMLVTTGLTSLYTEFPTTTSWDRPVLLRNTTPLAETPDGDQLYIATGYDNVVLFPDLRRTTAWTEIISAEGDSLASIGEMLELSCTGDSSFIMSKIEFMCAGDIHPASDDTDILVRYHWQQTCYEADAIVYNDSGINLRLYRFNSLDNIELLWSDASPSVTGNFHYSPDFPGCFFAASNGVIHKLSGLNGEPLESSPAIDADTTIWCAHPDRSGGDFVAVKNQTLRIYQLDTQTDITDDNYGSGLPADFGLSNPYPNPFNSSCIIEYSLPHRAHTTVTIHNVLGQKVATIVDGIVPAGNHRAAWNGSDQSGRPLASGIYLYRFVAGDLSDTKKILLLK